MKNLISICLIIALGFACQPQAPQRYFTDSPEIDIAKKAINAYESQDWSIYRQQFADTAHIYHNQFVEPMSIDSVIALHQANHASLSGVNFTGPAGDDPVYEMIVTETGDKWVHFWGVLNANFTPTGKDLAIPINISLLVQNDVITLDAVIYDSAPIVLEAMKIQEQEEDEHDDD